MISGAIGAGIGALGGAAFGSTGTNGFLGSWGPGVGVGLLVAGGAYAAATGNLDSFAGAVVGGVGGWAVGTKISTGQWPGSQPNAVRQSPAEKAQKSLSTDQQYELTTNYDIEGQPVSFNLMPVNESPAQAGLVSNTKGGFWPQTPGEMDSYLGVKGVKVPDTVGTMGRGKVVWQPSDNVKITYEQHPYHPDAPAFHSGPHWHLDDPSQAHATFVYGNKIPGAQVSTRN